MQVISWRAGVPVSERFDDPYYSLEDGLAETRYVFLQGNDLPNRFAPGFVMAELGFGTGLTMLVAWQAWRQAGQRGALRFVSFEAYPLSAADMAAALAPFDTLADLAEPALRAWQDQEGASVRHLEFPGLQAEIIIGDARQTVPNWPGRADAWCLDGFAPAKNPELWAPRLLGAVAAKSNPNATVATYTAAGAVRRALAEAGFTVARHPGFGRKRHMTRAVLECSILTGA